MKKNKVIAIIPARGGSKSIPGKNIKLLNGVPLIAYSIQACLDCDLVDRVIVSTDDPEIASIGIDWGAEVPFFRPTHLAADHTLDFPVMKHAVRWLEREEGYQADIVLQVRPTSPFRPGNLIKQGIRQLLKNKQADSLRTVTNSGENPYKMWTFDKNRVMQPLLASELPEPYNMPRQKLPKTYWQTGHLEVIRYQTIMEKGSLTGDTIIPLLVPRDYAVDLDNLLQWQFAEFLMQQGNLPIVEPEKSLAV